MTAAANDNSNVPQKNRGRVPAWARSWFFPYAWLVFVPLALIFDRAHSNPVLIFTIAVLGIIPVARLLAQSTEELSLRTSTVAGSLLNATFGNAIEFMIAIFAIRAGLIELVKASLIGSIVLNILLLIGLSMIFGGVKYRDQKFNRDSVGVASTMLLIAVAGLSLPTIYSALTGKSPIIMSQAVSITLAVTYVLSLIFVLFTHSHLFRAKRDVAYQATWSKTKALVVLLIFTVLAAVMSNVLVDVLRPILETTGLSEVFVGLVVIAVLTNIPEHITAITFGLRDNITQSIEIGMNSAIQIALFVAPILVFVAPVVGGQMNLAFAPFQMAAMFLTVMIINYLGSDGICNWLEGVQLVAVYVIIAIAFYFS